MLYHRYAKGETAIEGFLDDYAFIVYGLIALYEATFEDKYFQAAADLTKTMITKFWDEKNGGFYQTQNSETNLPKMKQLYDGAIPSGNSVALWDLLWLSRLTDEPKYETMATQMIKLFADEIERAPDAHTFFLLAVDFQTGPSFTVTIVGDLQDERTREMVKILRKNYMPKTVVSVQPPGSFGLGFQQIEGKATAYVCKDQTCLPPTNNVETMLEKLEIKTPYLGRLFFRFEREDKDSVRLCSKSCLRFELACLA